MNFDEIFEAYYNLYRMEAETPETTDDEYTVALRLANEAVNRWELYDNTNWRYLYNTLQLADDGDTIIVTGTTEYEAPSDMQKPSGFVKVLDSNGSMMQKYPIIEPNQVEFQGDDSEYAYFIGDPNNGFTLNINPAPTSTLNGMDLQYIYYKKASKFTTGDDFTQCPDSYFLINRMLAQRFRGSRNPYYQSAKNDAENALGQMKMTNDSGSPANTPEMADNSGNQWGS
jgi:hypothetical protein